MPTPPVDLVALARERAAGTLLQRCWRASLPDEYSAQVDELLDMPMSAMPHTVIAEVLRDVVGVPVGADGVARHRNGRCRCRRG